MIESGEFLKGGRGSDVRERIIGGAIEVEFGRQNRNCQFHD